MYVYKVNIICIRILIVNHTQSYGNYLTYEYLFYYEMSSNYIWYNFKELHIF